MSSGNKILKIISVYFPLCREEFVILFLKAILHNVSKRGCAQFRAISLACNRLIIICYKCFTAYGIPKNVVSDPIKKATCCSQNAIPDKATPTQQFIRHQRLIICKKSLAVSIYFFACNPCESCTSIIPVCKRTALWRFWRLCIFPY